MPPWDARVPIACADWVDEVVDWRREYPTDQDRMALAIELAHVNVVRGTGGPFGAVVFRRDTGVVVAAGVNSVVRLGCSVLHAEIVALSLAEQRIGSFTLRVPDGPPHELVVSCDPCAMCLGAALWSGVERLVVGATREDAEALGFDEGPVFPESYRYLEDRGLVLTRGVLRAEARAVLELYRRRGGKIYNG